MFDVAFLNHTALRVDNGMSQTNYCCRQQFLIDKVMAIINICR